LRGFGRQGPRIRSSGSHDKIGPLSSRSRAHISGTRAASQRSEIENSPEKGRLTLIVNNMFCAMSCQSHLLAYCPKHSMLSRVRINDIPCKCTKKGDPGFMG